MSTEKEKGRLFRINQHQKLEVNKMPAVLLMCQQMAPDEQFLMVRNLDQIR